MLKFKFFNTDRDTDPQVATGGRDMRFFLQDVSATAAATTAAPIPQAAMTSTASVNQATRQRPVTSLATKPVATKPVTTKPAATPRKVEPEPPTIPNWSAPNSLAIVDDDFEASITLINAKGVRSGYNPYESGCLIRKRSEPKKKPTDLRSLSKWIEQTRQLDKQG